MDILLREIKTHQCSRCHSTKLLKYYSKNKRGTYKKTCHKCLTGVEKEDIDIVYIELYGCVKEIESQIDSYQKKIDLLTDYKNKLNNLINIVENNKN
jgi:superfamily II DNA helicase RecQ